MIENNKMITAVYDLYVDDQLVESATIERPLEWIYGLGLMLPKFEENLAGKQEDDEFDFCLTAAEAYGERMAEGVVPLDKQMFAIDGVFDEERFAPGSVVPLRGEDGRVYRGIILAVDDTHVTVDLNHPMAGKDLHFKGKILSVRDATEAEIYAMQHPQGCGGGCGGGCGSDDCADGTCNCEGGCGGCC